LLALSVGAGRELLCVGGGLIERHAHVVVAGIGLVACIALDGTSPKRPSRCTTLD
jgi:hypothetical protein